MLLLFLATRCTNHDTGENPRCSHPVIDPHPAADDPKGPMWCWLHFSPAPGLPGVLGSLRVVWKRVVTWPGNCLQALSDLRWAAAIRGQVRVFGARSLGVTAQFATQDAIHRAAAARRSYNTGGTPYPIRSDIVHRILTVYTVCTI